ncbi:hypothetical protein KKI17_02905 [Patescibacteria group bacterium]|nr:hypothetical protein [Patescibacteria group bacterium]
MAQNYLENARIGIIGVGMIGGALQSYFKQKGIIPLAFDPPKGIGSAKELNQADVVFVCVPTPFRKEVGFDPSFVQGALKDLTGEKVVVIKSTVLPGTTEELQKQFFQHRLLFNPEFLVEENALEGMLHPERQIVGYTEKSRDIAETVMRMLPKASYEKVVPSREAEMVKYFGNAFLAVKVIFGNQMYELCQKLGVDYDNVRDAASADPRIGPSHLDVFHGGYRGYGGKCLVKDMRALLHFAERQGVDLGLLLKAEEINNLLLQAQGIDDPEQFSKRG